MPAPPPLTHESKTRAYVAWIAVCLLWGTTYLAIRIALETIGPLLMGAFRYLGAGAVLLAMLAWRGEKAPSLRQWRAQIVLGLLILGFGNGGVVWAEQSIPSGLTAVLVATTPFWMVGIDALMPRGERLTGRRMLGLAVGFSGIVLLVWPELQAGGAVGARFLGGVLSVQLACMGWAVGSSYSRAHGTNDNVLTTAGLQMVCGGLWLLAGGTLHGEWATLAFTGRTTAALLYLLFFGAVAGFTAYAYALKHLPVATVSLYAYINPVIAVALGTLVLGEPFSMRMVVAGAVVFTGVAIVRGRG